MVLVIAKEVGEEVEEEVAGRDMATEILVLVARKAKALLAITAQFLKTQNSLRTRV